MLARLINGCTVPCPKQGTDGSGSFHTNLPLYYARHLDVAAEDGYYSVRQTDKPDGDYRSSWALQEVEGVMQIVQTWTEYTPEPGPVDPIMERMDEQDAKIDYLAMMYGIDFEEVASVE